MTCPVVGRLAPSPTGALHVGNARSFLLAWLSVRQQGGRIVLRIEDIDSPRVKPWAMQATLDDLRWLGIDWDAGPEAITTERETDPAIAYVQTQRLERYHQVLTQLIAADVGYACECSRSEVAQAASAPHERSIQRLEGPIYPGTCREKKLKLIGNAISDTDTHTAAVAKFAWRWKFAEGEVSWEDAVRGKQVARPDQQLGDFVIARGDGTPAYQLAVVVDDHDMSVTEIVRGDDLLCSTYRQLAILEHLGWSRPNYYHVPLVVGSDGRRLAKRHGDTRLSSYREQGVSAEKVVGYLAWTLKLQDQPTPIRPRELIGRLDWRRLPTVPTVFREDELLRVD